MDTKELERFCPWARVELVDAVRRGMVQLSVDEAGRQQWPAGSEAVAGRALSPEERARRDRLMARAAEADDAAFAEREAYSWFNRLMALRYMELHGLLPWGGRALSAADGSFDPELATRAADLPLASLDRAAYLERAAEADDEGAFRLALEAACAELAGALPGVFEGASCDLLPRGLLARGEHGVIRHLVEDVPEDSWEDVEALGWAYQFYNSERKDEFFKSRRKAAAEDIAPATQLFTPDWIVRYMVQNSLGRLWMLNNPESPLRDKMEFYIEPDAEHEDFLHISGPEEITFCDPACGSGHILVYAFQLLTEMYRERGWRDRDIARSILESNLSGYEIDPRAAQIAQTALCMEALSLDRRWLSRGVAADVRVLGNIELDEEQLPETHVKRELADAIRHLGEVGSLLDPSPADLAALDAAIADAGAADLLGSALRGQLQEARGQLEALSRRFDVVVANPPYMKCKGINTWLSSWLKKQYPCSSNDLCTSFIDRVRSMTNSRGYQSLVTMQSWLASATYRKMRKTLLDNRSVLSLLHIGPKAFDSIGGDVVNTVAFSIYNAASTIESICFNLTDLQNGQLKEAAFLDSLKSDLTGRKSKTNLTILVNQMDFPLTAYKLNDSALQNLIKMQRLAERAEGSVGIQTGNNEQFIRNWWEPSIDDFGPHFTTIKEAAVSSIKWFPLNKGGDYRKWYGNDYDIINWYKDGSCVKQLKPGDSRHVQDYRNDFKFQPLITWSKIGGGAFRVKPSGFLSDMAGVGVYPSDNLCFYAAFLNSSVAQLLLDVISPSITKSVGEVRSLPVPINISNAIVEQLVYSCMALSKDDWNARETSWDFKRNPLV